MCYYWKSCNLKKISLKFMKEKTLSLSSYRKEVRNGAVGKDLKPMQGLCLK